MVRNVAQDHLLVEQELSKYRSTIEIEVAWHLVEIENKNMKNQDLDVKIDGCVSSIVDFFSICTHDMATSLI